MNLLENIKEALRQPMKYDWPFYVYWEKELQDSARSFLNFPHPYWLTVRFATKALPNKSVLRLFDSLGLYFDAWSGYEAARLIAAWISAFKIQLTSQEFAHNIVDLLHAWVEFNACSLHQLESYWKLFPWSSVWVRINPWLWSWGTNRTNVWWPSSSFGIWYEYIETIKEISQKYDLSITRIHTHIGSWTDPQIWNKTSQMSIDICEYFPDVVTLNLWWGYKIARMDYEKTTDIQAVGLQVKQQLIDFESKTWRKLHLEIEPWTSLVANSWVLVCKVQDIVDTWNMGYKFIKVDSGMTELLRPSLYGAQHPIHVVSNNLTSVEESDSYVVVGHCCESGDIFTPAPADPEGLMPRQLSCAQIWDFVLIGGAGAYSSSMASIHYNSFPQAAEYLLTESNQMKLIRRRELPQEIWRNEV